MSQETADSDPISRTALAATVAIIGLEFVLPVTVLQVYDRVIPSGGGPTLTVIACAAGMLLVTECILRFARTTILAFQDAVFTHRVSVEAVGLLMRSRRADTIQTPGTLLSILSAVRAFRDTAKTHRFVSYAELSIVPLALLLIALIAGWLVVVPALCIVVCAAMSWRDSQKLAARVGDRGLADDARFDFMIDVLHAIHSIKSLAMEDRMIRRYESLKLGSSGAGRQVADALTASYDRLAGLGMLMSALLLSLGAFLVMRGQLSAGALIATMIVSGRIMPPLQRMLGLGLHRKSTVAEARKAGAALASRPLTTTAIEGDVSNLGELKLHDVSFVSAGKIILSRADFNFPVGEMVWLDIVDFETRAAVYRLLAGITLPDSGRVEVDGMPAGLLTDDARMRSIAFLQADPVTYSGTIMANLSRFGASTLTDVLYVARLLRLDRDLATLPRGLDTELRGDQSDGIPPGLRQRVAMCRQLAPRPRLILFDNADSGLDRSSYVAIHSLLSRLRGKATIILSSADPALQALARRRVILSDGRLLAEDLPRGAIPDVVRYRELRM